MHWGKGNVESQNTSKGTYHTIYNLISVQQFIVENSVAPDHLASEDVR